MDELAREASPPTGFEAGWGWWLVLPLARCCFERAVAAGTMLHFAVDSDQT